MMAARLQRSGNAELDVGFQWCFSCDFFDQNNGRCSRRNQSIEQFRSEFWDGVDSRLGFTAGGGTRTWKPPAPGNKFSRDAIGQAWGRNETIFFVMGGGLTSELSEKVTVSQDILHMVG